MPMHGCELWNLNEKDVNQFKVAWRKLNEEYGIFLLGHTIIWCATLLITLTLLLINVLLDLFTIP